MIVELQGKNVSLQLILVLTVMIKFPKINLMLMIMDEHVQTSLQVKHCWHTMDELLYLQGLTIYKLNSQQNDRI